MPPPPSGFSIVSSQVTVDGRLATYCSTFDANAAWRNYRRTRETNPDAAIFQPMPARTTGMVLILEDAKWQALCEFPLESPWCKFDVAPDGWCVIAYSRCRAGDRNARVFSVGQEQAIFALGDGIQHLQCDARDGIWTGYFDEGIYGDDPLSHAGLQRFSRSGQVSAGFQTRILPIDDCYALNVGAAATWASWYSEFPIVRISKDFSMRQWSNNVYRGAHALAVDDPYVLFAGGYNEDRNRMSLVKLDTDGAQLVCDFDARHVFDIEDLWATKCVGRGDRLHVVTNEEWHSIGVNEVVAR